MRDTTIARNYAETLFELAQSNEGLDVYGDGIQMIADLLDSNPRMRLFLETPRISAEDKKDVVRRAFGGALPKRLISFILITIDKRRQRLLRAIAREFSALVDEHLGREHVSVTVARPMDEDTKSMVAQRLSDILGKKVIPHVEVKPAIVGGILVRAGDTIYDGTVRRQLDDMRRQLLRAELPAGSPA